MVRKRSAACKKRRTRWLNLRRIIPGLLLLLLLFFSMAAAGYVIFFRATPVQAANSFSL